MKHRRVWVVNDPTFDAGDRHPEGCEALGTWCTACGCCQHCFHDCDCTVGGCQCGTAEHAPEPSLFVVEDDV